MKMYKTKYGLVNLKLFNILFIIEFAKTFDKK